MEGLTWLDIDGFKILRVDYGAAQDPLQLMHATKQEQYKFEGPCVYSLTNFGGRIFSSSFVQEYERTSRDLLSEKKIVAAYINLAHGLFDDAKRIISSIVVARKTATIIEFFETEPAAIEWLMSFKECD